MVDKPTCEELTQRVLELEKTETERRHVEEKLQEPEIRLKALSEASFEAIFLSEKGVCLDQNQAAERIFGYTRAEAIGRHGTEWIAPEDHEQVKKNMVSGNEKPYEVTALKKDGTTFPCEVQARMTEYQGRPVRITALRDISDRKQAEEALRESEKKYRLLADNVTDNIWILDLGTLSFSYVSPSVMGINGYTPEEATGLQLQDVLTPLSMELATGVLSEELSEQKRNPDPSRSRILELEQYRKDGTTYWTEVSMQFICDDEGHPLSILGVTRDVSKRKQAEDALRESKERFELALKFSNDGLFDWNLETNAIHYSSGWKKMLGYEDHEIKNEFSEWERLTKPEDAKTSWAILNELLEGKRNRFQREFKMRHKDGHWVDILSRANVVLNEKGKSIRLVGTHIDITERKRAEEEKRRLEEQLRQAQKMEAIGTLAGGIAHDFNNLLMGIQGRTSIMLMDKDSSHPDFEHLRGIEDYIGNAVDLTRQLLGFARGGKYEVKPTDLNELIQKESRMFGRTKKEITIREKYEENIWSVEIDRGQIQQVLLNLHVNAWQAMPGGGDLYLETENMTLSENYVKPFPVEPGRYVKLSITDTGLGMDKATQERIFDPFFTTKGMGRGTGLGLASAYGIIKNHGGFINVYSEKGHGSTFSIYLPAFEKKAVKEKNPDGNTLKGVETVLFVDDEKMITEVAGNLLELLGYKVLIAGSGKEAITIYEDNKERIDMVILDMIMPDMNGGETYDRMKDINPDIKVLLSSGYSIGERAEKILDRGCNGFIQKPFRIEELSQKLREILDEK